ncbi:dynein regulatory complex subunit 5 [Schistocerca cancellata]|uniref:dynein regulatory complex subunit 5 n=1 Tax=Schistocerca cancellata TaxID=274614 RepID=UPI0021173B3B|nr:dynein regulatory complex subunit 5 [Schistocerca cancellata]
MRIPHTIPKNAYEVYKPSRTTLNLVGEDARPIKAENITWDEDIPPTLVTLCVQSLVQSFKDRPVLDLLPPEALDLLLETLPTDLPVKLTVPLIRDGIYWERSARNRWKSMNDVHDYGGSWKRLYIERHLQDELEMMPVENFVGQEVAVLVSLCSSYVHRLRLRQLKVARLPPLMEGPDECSTELPPMNHIDLALIIRGLTELEELDIVFGELNCGMDFKWSFFKFAVSDCHNIGIGMESLQHITILRLHRCTLDDIRLAALLQHLVNNKTLIELDFSHCLVGDAGAMALGKLLQSHPTLNILNLCNNMIGSKGAEGLAYGISHGGNCPLKCLNLRLNSMIKDEGVAFLCAALALMEEGRLAELNLAGCTITSVGALSIGEMLVKNQSLRILDLSNNQLDEKGGKYLEDGLKHNQTLLQLDLRVTGILEENSLNIMLDLQKNKELHKKQQKKLRKAYKSRVYFQDMV